MPFFGVLDRDGKVPRPADTVEYSQVDQLYAWVTRVIAPRGRARVDIWDPRRGTWAHAYEREIVLGERMPREPFAIYLTDFAGRFRLLVFDLDAHGEDDAQLWADACALEELLDAAGLRYVIVKSGPGASLHFWVAVPEGVDKDLVRSIAYAAGARMPRLDKSPLTNEHTGCVRPPGAPHRDGGHSRVLYPAAVAETADVLRIGNPAERIERLAQLLGVDEATGRHAQPRAEQCRPVVREGGAERIVGTRGALSSDVERLLKQQPAPGQGHAAVASICTRLALARWSYGDFAELVDANTDAPGLEHLRSQGHRSTGRRTPRSSGQAAAVASRQWARCVRFAATLPPRSEGHSSAAGDSEEVIALCRRVEEILAAVDEPGCWTRQAGPSDKKALLYVAQCTLDGLAEEVEVDCRRSALNTGMGRSTAARAHQRLIADGRLELVAVAEGQKSATYRLTSTDSWTLVKGGTQAVPRPPGGVIRSRDELRLELRRRLDLAGHDVWAEGCRRGEPAGLGRHAATTYGVLVKQGIRGGRPYNVRALAEITGYGLRTVRAHLARLGRYQLCSERDGGWASGPGDLDTVALQLGVAGTRRRRAATYEAERDMYDWWTAELDWLRAPKRHRRRAGPRARQDADDEQVRIIDPALPSWSRRARYPRTIGGRPDHAAARRRMLGRQDVEPTPSRADLRPCAAVA